MEYITFYRSIVIGKICFVNFFFNIIFHTYEVYSFIDFDYKKVLIFNIISKIAELKILLN